MRFHEKWVEYDLDVRQGGTYDVSVRYAAMGERPVRLSLDGTVLNEDTLGRVSGSWGNDVPLRIDRTTLKLRPGKHVLRLEAKGLTGNVFDIVIAASDSAGSIPAIQKARDRLLRLARDGGEGLKSLPPGPEVEATAATVSAVEEELLSLDTADVESWAKTDGLGRRVDASRRRLHNLQLARLSQSRSDKVVVWVSHPLVKVFRDEVLAGKINTEAISIEACRNEYEPAQICITSWEYRGPVRVSATPLVHSSGDYRIPGIGCRFVGYVPVEHGGDELRKPPALFPDPLVLDNVTTLEPGQSQPVWITVKVPMEALPGDYQATVEVITADGSTSLPLRLKVYPMAIPEEVHFWLGSWGGDIWQAEEAGIAVSAGGGHPTYPPEFFSFLRDVTLMNRYEHRAMAFSDIPVWQVFDRLIRVHWTDGAYSHDFSLFDKLISTIEEAYRGQFKVYCVSFGCERGGEGGGLTGTVPVFRPDGSPDTERSFSKTPVEDPRYLAFVEDAFRTIEQHVRARGWLDRVYVKVMDETNDGKALEDVRLLARLIRRVAPGIRQNATVGYDHMLKEEYVDLPILGSWMLDRYPGAVTGETAQDRRDAWSYNEHRGLIDGSLVYPRMIGWRAYLYGLKGYSHWAWAWSKNAQADPNFLRQVYSDGRPHGPGEHFLVYFDKARREIVDSLRWEMLRETAEDYETLRLLEKAGGDSKNYCRQLIRKSDGYDVFETDPEAIYKVRHRVLEEIAQRMGVGAAE